jgi:CheY-like chemotaxis protein/HPt (histidine-containing phosphotransfer) domain-containing protein
VPLKTIGDSEQQERGQPTVHDPKKLPLLDNLTPSLVGKSLQGIRVLVVDDGEINCEVARRILNGHGAVVSLATNGQEAIDWLVKHPSKVDLVLMDVQMPVMGGIEATRLLRLMPAFAHLPIVALTAGAFKSQQDAAHAVGMTHFISKPFDVPSTITLIQRLTRQAALNTASQPPSLGAVWSPDVAVINVAEGLKIWADMPSYLEWLGRFVGLYAGAVPSMQNSLAGHDRAAAVALAHKLAGVAANLAMPAVLRTAAEAERVLSGAPNQAQAELALAELAAAMNASVTTIQRMTAA